MAAVGMGVTLARGLLTAPAIAFFTAVSWLTLVGAFRRGGGWEEAAFSLARTWGSPRARSILLGVWLAGILLWGALRVAWVAGAMPLVAWRLAGCRGEQPTFAAGVAWRFHRVLPAALAALAMSAAGQAMLLLGAFAVFRIAAPAQASASPGALAFVTAGALVAAIGLATSLSVLGDVAVARAALGGEGPVRALSGAVRSFLARPAAFLVAVLAVWVATALAAGAVQGFLGALAGSVRSGPRAMLLFPELALSVIAALVASGAEMWRLAAVGALALGDQAEREARPSSLRSESLGIRPPSQ
jgi:hypothetical protein